LFQPDGCALDAFSHKDVRLLAASPGAPRRWLLFLGSSKDRGVFSRAVDAALPPDEKRKMHASALKKCWGWLDVHIPGGRLRLSFGAPG
jgi:hypothetical protein